MRKWHFILAGICLGVPALLHALTTVEWNATNPVSGSYNYDINRVARAFYVAAIASDGDGLQMAGAGGSGLTVAEWNATNPVSGSYNYDIDRVARAFYVAAVASDGYGLQTILPDPLAAVGNLTVGGKLAVGGTALDQNRYLNLDVSISPTSQTYGSYAKILSDTNANVTGDYSYVLISVPDGETVTSVGGQYGFVGNNGTGTIDHGHAISANATNGSTGTFHRALGVFGTVQNVSTGTVDDATAVAGTLNFTGAGAVTEAAMLEAKLAANAAGSEVTDLYGLKITDWGNAGTVTNSFAIGIDDTIGVGTAHWAIHSLSTSPSLLSGSLDVTGRVTPGELIIPSGTTPGPVVEGALFLDSDASANGTLVMYSNGAWRTVAAW